MDIEQILSELEYYNGVMPREALRQAVTRQEEITPALLSILEYALQLPDELEDDDYFAHTYAMYLLAQFREKRAYPLLVKFFCLQDEIVETSTGDIVTQDLQRILASVSHGDSSLLKPLIQNDSLNEWVRSAALETLVTQVAKGEANRQDIMDYFTWLFRGGLTRKPNFIWASLVACACDLYPGEVFTDIRQAFEEGLVDETFVDWKWVEGTMKRGKESILQELSLDKQRRFIEDTIIDIGWWSCFSEPLKIKKSATQLIKPDTKQKVGRNDPCPCGSGKKYKKCCGR